MKYFIRALADFGTTHAPSREPSSYSDAELTNGVDGIWQCGESENPDVFGKKYRCGGACHSDEARRRRALGGTDGYIFCFSVLSSIKNTTTNLGNKFLFVFVSIIFLDYSSDVSNVPLTPGTSYTFFTVAYVNDDTRMFTAWYDPVATQPPEGDGKLV